MIYNFLDSARSKVCIDFFLSYHHYMVSININCFFTFVGEIAVCQRSSYVGRNGRKRRQKIVTRISEEANFQVHICK